MAAIDGGPVSQGRDHTGQKVSGPEKKKKECRYSLLRQLIAEPTLSRARLESLQKSRKVQTCTQKRGRAVLAKGQEQRLEGAMDTCP